MAGEDFGLLSGIAQGLNQGVQSYQEAKRDRWNRNLQQGLLQEHGMNIDPDTGEVTMLPYKQQENQYKQNEITKNLARQSPTSDASVRGAAARGSIYNKLDKNIGKQLQGMSLEEQENFDKSIGSKYTSGELGLLGKQQTNAMMGQRLDLQGQRLNNQQTQAGNHAVDQNAVLNTYTIRADGAQKILNLIAAAKAGKFKSNKAFLGQMNAEVARLETGSQSPGLGASEKTEMESSAADLRAVIDKLANTVSDVPLYEQMDQASGMVKDLGNSYAQALDNKYQNIKAGQTPLGAKAIDAKHRQALDRYGKVFDYTPSYSSGSQNSEPKQSKGKIPNVGDTVNGYIYRGGPLDKQTSWEKNG